MITRSQTNCNKHMLVNVRSVWVDTSVPRSGELLEATAESRLEISGQVRRTHRADSFGSTW